MNDKLIAFWKHDCPPLFCLWGHVDEIKGANVTVKEYPGLKFTPFLITDAERGYKLAQILENLGDDYDEEIRKIKETFNNKVEEAFSRDEKWSI